MKPDDELCLCFGVTFRKIVNFARIERIRQASQLSNCFGAGSGCGWCRKTLSRIGTEIAEHGAPEADKIEEWLEQFCLNKRQYTQGREKYRSTD